MLPHGTSPDDCVMLLSIQLIDLSRTGGTRPGSALRALRGPTLRSGRPKSLSPGNSRLFAARSIAVRKVSRFFRPSYVVGVNGNAHVSADAVPLLCRV